VFDLACLLMGWGQPDPVVEELDGVSATPKVKVATIRRDWSPGVRRGFPADSVPMSFGPGSCPSLRATPVAYVRRDAYDRRGRVACAAVPAPPVYDAALEVTMCPMVHSFRTSGGVAATGEA
jgi:hypothetical protein